MELVENSSLSATCRMTCWMPIPAGLNEARTARLAETVETAIITDITLKKGSKRLVCKTTLDNRCRDHLLTVSFPTGRCVYETGLAGFTGKTGRFHCCRRRSARRRASHTAPPERFSLRHGPPAPLRRTRLRRPRRPPRCV